MNDDSDDENGSGGGMKNIVIIVTIVTHPSSCGEWGAIPDNRRGQSGGIVSGGVPRKRRGTHRGCRGDGTLQPRQAPSGAAHPLGEPTTSLQPHG